jgi:predicted phage tail protein
MWGSEVINGRSLGNVRNVTVALPTGSYYVRLRARNAIGTSTSSDPVLFRIGSQLSSPTGLAADWSGTQTTLNWVASAVDSPELAPTDYVLEVGTAPGLADVAIITVGEQTSFSTDVPYGVYYVRVRAANGTGDSNPTPEFVVAPPGTAQAPLDLSSAGEGSTATLSWTQPPGSETPAGYIIEVGSDPGLSDIATIRVGNVTSFTTEAPPGTYFVRVRAINALGAGLPSNEVIVQK